MNFIEQLKAAKGKQLLIGGHRGNLSEVRENTIENFEQVLNSGICHIEIDVQLTKDNQLVVYHDLQLSEKSPLTGMVHDFTLEELKNSFEINTLDEILDWCTKNNQPAALEIKSRPLDMSSYMPILGQKLCDCVADHDFFDMSFVFSTDYSVLRAIKTRNNRINLGLIVPQVPVDPVALMAEMDAIIYLCYIDNLSADIIEKLHTAGYYVDGSVINTEQRLKKAMEIGVDLIESDFPLQMLEHYSAI